MIARADSLLLTTTHVDTTSPELPTFTVRTSCNGLNCLSKIPVRGTQLKFSLSDLEITSSSSSSAILSKHGITLVDSKPNANLNAYGSWMNHAFFGVQFECLDVSGITVTGRFGLASGDLTGSQPTETVNWRGLMVGMPVTGSYKGNRLQGDASLTYNLGSQSLDASFSNIKDIDRLRSHSTSSFMFTAVPVTTGGKFSTGSAGNRIEGGFYGSGHAEAAGTVERSGIVGAFGAKRQQ